MSLGLFCVHLPKADRSWDPHPGSIMLKLFCGISNGCLLLESTYVDSLKKVVGNRSRSLILRRDGVIESRNVMAVGRDLCVCSVFPSECSGQLHTLWSGVLGFSCDCTGKWDTSSGHS